MRHIGWISHLGPSVVLFGLAVAGSAIAGSSLAAQSGLAAAPRSCPPANAFASAVSPSVRHAPIDAQLDLATTLGPAGEVTGRVLEVSTATGRRSIVLAGEAFDSPPIANVVLYGQASLSGGKVRALDLETGCDFSLFSSADVVRSAVIDAGLDAIYVHTVSPTDRSDRGVRRIDLASGDTRMVVPGLAAAEPLGVTYATLLRWSIESDSLAVQSCGSHLCRTRVLDVGSGGLATYAQPHGQIVGLDRASLFAFKPCHQLPCPIEAIDRQTGQSHEIATDAYSATLSEVSGNAVLIVETSAGTKEIRP